MPRRSTPERILLVTGLSGAGKSTALRTLEDLGWEVVDNLPLSLLEHLLSIPLARGSRRRRPLAIGIDSRTRDFNANHIVEQIRRLVEQVRMVKNVLDENTFEESGSIDLQVAIQARAGDHMRPTNIHTECPMEYARRWATTARDYYEVADAPG